jgi:transcriptional regulator with XRE-family HTH domain
MKERIEQILKDKKLSQSEFADRIGVNRSSITHLMTGRNKSSETVLARTLLVFSDINPQWLSEGIGKMYKSFQPATDTSTTNTENKTFEDENSLALFDSYLPEEKPQIPTPLSSQESHNQPSSNNESVISSHRYVEKENKSEQENKSPNAHEKQIRKIVFFYDDKTFEEYYPEKTL